jgi:HAD superfamily hydrolase (TIGR01509 family)
LGYTISYKDHISTFNGLPTKVKLDLLDIEEDKQKDIWSMKQERTLDNIKKFGRADLYKIRMLKKLKEEGYKLGCVTNSIRKTTTQMLKVTGQFELFDEIITNEDVENNKPSPDCYLLAFQRLGVPKEKVVIVEDSPKGKQSAHASGAKVIEVEDAYDVTYDFIRSKI